MTLGLGPEEWQAVLVSLKVASVATLAMLPLAVLVAKVLARGPFPGHAALNIVVHLPLVLPPVVTGYALLLLFSPSAPLGRLLESAGLGLAFRWQGAALAAGVMAFPLMVRAIRLGFEAVDAGLVEAARTLGCSPLAAFWRVVLPLILPSLIAGVVLGFAKAMGEFGAIITFAASIPGETRTIPSAIYGFLQRPGSEGAVLRLVGVSVAVSVGALLCSEWMARRAARR